MMQTSTRHRLLKRLSEILNDLIGNTLSINFVDESSAFYCHPWQESNWWVCISYGGWKIGV